MSKKGADKVPPQICLHLILVENIEFRQGRCLQSVSGVWRRYIPFGVSDHQIRVPLVQANRFTQRDVSI